MSTDQHMHNIVCWWALRVVYPKCVGGLCCRCGQFVNTFGKHAIRYVCNPKIECWICVDGVCLQEWEAIIVEMRYSICCWMSWWCVYGLMRRSTLGEDSLRGGDVVFIKEFVKSGYRTKYYMIQNFNFFPIKNVSHCNFLVSCNYTNNRYYYNVTHPLFSPREQQPTLCHS